MQPTNAGANGASAPDSSPVSKHKASTPKESSPASPSSSGPHVQLPAWLWGALAVAAVLLALGVSALFIKKDASHAASKAASQSTAAAKNATNLATVSAVAFNPPANLAAFGPDRGDAAYHDYVSKSGTCEFAFGTLTAQDVPGSDINAIIAPQVTALRKQGAVVDGPSAAAPLLLKDAHDASIIYSMPTLHFDFSMNARHGSDNYSLVVLQDSTRVIVNRICVNQKGLVSQRDMSSLDTTAKQLTVVKK